MKLFDVLVAFAGLSLLLLLGMALRQRLRWLRALGCLLYTSDAADE